MTYYYVYNIDFIEQEEFFEWLTHYGFRYRIDMTYSKYPPPAFEYKYGEVDVICRQNDRIGKPRGFNAHTINPDIAQLIKLSFHEKWVDRVTHRWEYLYDEHYISLEDPDV